MIIKPYNQETDTLEPTDNFYKTSHLLSPMNGGEYTLCGVACEEWGYDKYKEVKSITCEDCKLIIKECIMNKCNLR